MSTSNTNPLFPHANLLLCPPEHYDVRYEINPWMKITQAPDRTRAKTQWITLLHTLLRLGAWVEYIEPLSTQPDMVFTANAGLVHGKQVVLSNFKFTERQGEEAAFSAWFSAAGYQVLRLNTGSFEGEGDALFAGEKLFCGYGFRTDLEALNQLPSLLNIKQLITCHLILDYFYHLDTCFCPLDAGRALYFPAAFTAESISCMKKEIELIEIPENDARRFACNAVLLGQSVVIPAGCSATEKILKDLGYETFGVELDEFIKAGGAAKCLVVRL